MPGLSDVSPAEIGAAHGMQYARFTLQGDERALTSTLPPLSDPRAAARAVYDAVAGFGPLQRTSTTGRSRR